MGELVADFDLSDSVRLRKGWHNRSVGKERALSGFSGRGC